MSDSRSILGSRPETSDGIPTGREHLAMLRHPLAALEREVDRLDRWGTDLARALLAGHRLLAAGNGGSAAQAQHLTSELVGRFRDDRPPFSAIALHADTSTVTAVANDYAYEELFARQVRAHGRPGDVLVLLSTSGRSANTLAAAETGTRHQLIVWSLTGPGPNPLARRSDDALCVPAPSTATIQEIHQVAIHLLCARLEVQVAAALRLAQAQAASAGRTGVGGAG
jgi:D-sedoheptulose 7-phosphate isomerase